MPYITSEEVKSIRNEIKKAFPDFKFSITRESHSTVRVAIMEGNLDFGGGHIQVNGFYVKENYKDQPEIRDMFLKILEIIHNEKEMIVSEEETDYGRWPNYYINLHVGKWDKDYKKVA